MGNDQRAILHILVVSSCISLYLVILSILLYSGPDIVKYPVHTRDHGRAWTAPRARDPDPVRSASPSVPDSPSHAARPVPSPRATANESSIPSRRVRARPESGVRILHVYVSRRSRSRRRGAARRGSRDMIIPYDWSLADPRYCGIGRYVSKTWNQSFLTHEHEHDS
jgi:hypothetical protein